MLITIAGASGFIGKHLIEQLNSKFKIRGLSRSAKGSGPNLEWKCTDLFSLESTDAALKDTDVAIFLVHSMLPSSRLFQGNFQDTDLMLADNFAISCVKNNIKQIIYLGGPIPNSGMSKHLTSRNEVEEVFKSTQIPLTILRAGMVVGNGGSSFEILKNLVLNLPLMVLPRWTQSNTQTIYLADLIAVIMDAIGNNKYFNKVIDVVNGEKISYKELIQQTAHYLDKKIFMLPVPINYTSFSKLWVTLFGETDYELVSPLIDSLLCDLPNPAIPQEISHLINFKTYQGMLQKISKNKIKKNKIKNTIIEKNVRSIQRIKNSKKLNALQISDEYFKWIPIYLHHLIQVKKNGPEISFFALGMKKSLFDFIQTDVTNDGLKDNNFIRVKFDIVAGLLVQKNNNGCFEIRQIAHQKYTLVSINNFIPSLPWYLYKFGQAPFHLKIMHAFEKHLEL